MRASASTCGNQYGKDVSHAPENRRVGICGCKAHGRVSFGTSVYRGACAQETAQDAGCGVASVRRMHERRDSVYGAPKVHTCFCLQQDVGACVVTKHDGDRQRGASTVCVFDVDHARSNGNNGRDTLRAAVLACRMQHQRAVGSHHKTRRCIRTKTRRMCSFAHMMGQGNTFDGNRLCKPKSAKHVAVRGTTKRQQRAEKELWFAFVDGKEQHSVGGGERSSTVHPQCWLCRGSRDDDIRRPNIWFRGCVQHGCVKFVQKRHDGTHRFVRRGGMRQRQQMRPSRRRRLAPSLCALCSRLTRVHFLLCT